MRQQKTDTRIERDLKNEAEEPKTVIFRPQPVRMSRGEVLDKAKEIICKDRNATHGEPEDSFAPIASFWSVYLNFKYGMPVQLTNLDVSMMMSLFKHGRQVLNPANPDNYLDGVGYMAIGGSMGMEIKPEPVNYPDKSESIGYAGGGM